MKKILSLTIIFALILCAVSVFPVSAVMHKVHCGDFWYTPLGGGKAAIGITNTETTGKVTIPETIDGYEVTEIALCGFSDSDITEIVIPDFITRINDYAFSDCTKLTSVTISDGVESIGYCAFVSCYSLNRIYIPPTVTEIEDCAIGYEDSYIIEDGEKLYDGGYWPFGKVIIEGYTGSETQTYAKEHFEAVSFAKIYEYKEDVFRILHLDSSADESLAYFELYKHFETTEAKPGATPDYAVVEVYEKHIAPVPVAIVVGDYVMRRDYYQFPGAFSYFIYVPETQKLYPMETAFNQDIPGIYKFFTEHTFGSQRIGDVNYDDELNIKDATLIQKNLAGLSTIWNNLIEGLDVFSQEEPLPRYIGDFNRDGNMNIKDATAIQKHLAGISG